MEPDVQDEPVHIGTMSRAGRRSLKVRGLRRGPFGVPRMGCVPLSVIGWQFVKQRDTERHTPRINKEPRRWQVEKLRRRLSETTSDGLGVALEQIA